MDIKAMFQHLISDNEQDRAAMREWWESHGLAVKLQLLDRITKVYDDPIDEIMSRFAQSAFTDCIEKYGA